MLAYTERGNGETLVLIHGFCENKAVWDDFIEPLSKNYRVITLDLPGFGDSLNDVRFYSMEAMADAVYQLLVQLEVKKCVMVGHSLGGYVTLAFADKYADMLLGIGLFHSSAFPDSEEKRQNRNKVIDYVERNGVEAFIRPFVPPLFFMRNRERCEKDIQKMIDIGLETPLETITHVTKAMRDREDRVPLLNTLSFPVLFIVGKEDGSVPLEYSLQQIQLPKRSVVYFFEETGHMGMFERKEETLKAVDAFVRYCN